MTPAHGWRTVVRGVCLEEGLRMQDTGKEKEEPMPGWGAGGAA